jgi:hypothetical protein
MSAPWETQSNFDTQDKQARIAEWTYRDKMETLFVLQLLFLGIMTTALFAILSKLGFFDSRIVYVVGATVLIVVTLVWYFRSAYTKGTRDKYTWDRRYFSGDFGTDPVVSPTDVANAAKAAIALCQAKKAAAGLAGASITCPTS